MTAQVLLAIGDASLREALYDAVGAHFKSAGETVIIQEARDVADAKVRHDNAPENDFDFLVVEAELAMCRKGDEPSDEPEGLRELARWRESGDSTPAVLISTSGSLTVVNEAAGIAYCKVVVVDGEIFQALQKALTALWARRERDAATAQHTGPGTAYAPSAVVELSLLRDQGQRYEIFVQMEDQEVTRKGELRVESKLLDELMERADAIRREEGNWEIVLRTIGKELYDNICQGTFTRHFDQACGYVRDQDRVNIRFTVDPTLFSVPFEALYDKRGYYMLETPMARAIYTEEPVRASEINADRPLRVLFIEADVGKDDVLKVPDDEPWGRSLPQFETLHNLADERRHLAAIVERLREDSSANGDREVVMECIDRSMLDAEKPRFRDLLEHTLVDSPEPFDIVHFAGHSTSVEPPRSRDDAPAFLILPGEPYSEALPASEFADWIKAARTKIVFLSACRSTDADAARALARRGVPVVVGFRWDLEDDLAAEYAREFYERVLLRRESYVQAFRSARRRMRTDHRAKRIWAAATLIVQSREWYRSGAIVNVLH